MDSYEKLANAIVLQAVKDYRTALKRVARHPKDRDGIFYDRSEVWIESEKLYEVLYSFEMEA